MTMIWFPTRKVHNKCKIIRTERERGKEGAWKSIL